MSEEPIPAERGPDPGLSLDGWRDLRQHTGARIALNRAGASLPTEEVLAFGLAHAKARDAVHTPLSSDGLARRLAGLGLPSFQTRSRATSRAVYLRRPDLGRQLPAEERAVVAAQASGPVDVAIVIADGLSAAAVQANAAVVLDDLTPRLRQDGLSLSPVAIVAQGRVAIGDAIGELLQAQIVLMLIGERPGLSSSDSLGAYTTYAPRIGRTDADRNCISNIRPQGLPPQAAATTAHWLVRETLSRKVSGVALKDESGADNPSLRPSGRGDDLTIGASHEAWNRIQS